MLIADSAKIFIGGVAAQPTYVLRGCAAPFTIADLAQQTRSPKQTAEEVRKREN